MNSTFSPFCFGKLPTFGDFVRFNAAGKEIQQLDQWFQEGLYFAKNRLSPNWDLAYKKASDYRFLFPSYDNGRCIFGMFFPSVDKIGRQYPFFLALSAEIAFFRENSLTYAPFIFQPFIQKAAIMGHRAVQGQMSELIPAEVEALTFNLNQMLTTLQPEYETFKNKTTIAEYISQIWQNIENPYTHVVFENLIELFISLRNHDVARLNYGLRIPLGRHSLSNSHWVSFWLELISQMLPQYTNIPYLFYTNSEFSRSNYLFVYFSLPSPNNLASLIQVELELDTVYKLDAQFTSGENVPEKKLLSQLKELFQNSELPLIEFQSEIFKIFSNNSGQP